MCIYIHIMDVQMLQQQHVSYRKSSTMAPVFLSNHQTRLGGGSQKSPSCLIHTSWKRVRPAVRQTVPTFRLSNALPLSRAAGCR